MEITEEGIKGRANVWILESTMRRAFREKREMKLKRYFGAISGAGLESQRQLKMFEKTAVWDVQ